MQIMAIETKEVLIESVLDIGITVIMPFICVYADILYLAYLYWVHSEPNKPKIYILYRSFF